MTTPAMAAAHDPTTTTTASADHQRTGVPRWVVLLLAWGILISFAALDFSLMASSGLSPFWGSPAGVLCVTQAFLHGNRLVSRGVMAGQVGIVAVLVLAAALLHGPDPGQAMAMALWSWVVGLAAALLLRGVGVDSAPRKPADVIWILGAVLVAAMPASFVPVVPGVPLGELSWVSIWWSTRVAALMFITFAVWSVVCWFPTRWNADSRREAPLIVPVVAFSFLTLWAYFNNPDLPVTWLVLLPAVWCGMVITPRGVVGYGMATSIAGMAVPLLTGVQPRNEGLMPGTVLADLLFATTVSISLILSLSRFQNSQLDLSLAGERSSAARRSALLAKVFEGMSDGAVVVNHRFEAVRQNSSARRILGPLPPGDLSDFLPQRGWRQSTGEELGIAGFVKALHGHPVQTSLTMTDAEGRQRFFNVELSAVGDESDRVLILFTDVTEDHLRQEELRAFAGVVAHDLRAPLTAVDGWLELLQEAVEDGDDAGARRALGQVVAGSGRMRRMIEEWLAATANATHTDDSVLVDLTSLLAQVTAQLSSSDPRQPVMIVATPHLIAAEPVLIRQVFANLCSNALKYTKPEVRPVVEITSRMIDSEVVVAVRDNGIGVPAEELERIFEDGHRAHAHQGSFVGTGRGLTLVARVVRRFGGRVWATRNEDGPGSTFYVALPGRLADVATRPRA